MRQDAAEKAARPRPVPQKGETAPWLLPPLYKVLWLPPLSEVRWLPALCKVLWLPPLFELLWLPLFYVVRREYYSF